MLRVLVMAAALLSAGMAAWADIVVRETEGRVDVTAKAAPLAEVLERIGRQTGMKVVYEGQAPRQLVTLALLGRSPAEAVVSVLEGQGLNYALVMDATATRVDKLLVSSSGSSPLPAVPAVAATAAVPEPRSRRLGARPSPVAEPDPEPVAPEEDTSAPVADPAGKPPDAGPAGERAFTPPGPNGALLPGADAPSMFHARPLLLPPSPAPTPQPAPTPAP